MKRYLSVFLLIAFTASLKAQSITLTDVYTTTYCTEALYSVAFTATGSFNSGNVFQVQLSDSAGNFSTSSTIIARVTSSSAGDQNPYIIIPSTVPSGSNYLMRVVSTDPVVRSFSNKIPLTIHSPKPVLSPVGAECLKPGTELVAKHVSGATTITWNFNGVAVHSEFSGAYKSTIVAGGSGMGSNANQLDEPQLVWLDGSGNIYVADNKYRIQEFPANSAAGTNGVTVAGGNGSGSANNQFVPGGLFVDGPGNCYVSDYTNNRVLKFPAGSTSATMGTIIAGGNGSGSGADQLNGPSAIFVDGTGNLYVVDANNNRVQKFPVGSNTHTNGVTVAGGNGSGSAANQLKYPASVFVDGSGNIYVADDGNHRVQKFGVGSTSSTAGETVAGGNGGGSGANQFSGTFGPEGLFVDASYNLYVLDHGNNRLQEFPPNSSSTTNGVTILSDVANDNPGYGSIYIDDNGNIYTANWNHSGVDKFNPADADSTYTTVTRGSFTANYTDAVGCVGKNSAAIVIHKPQPDPILAENIDTNLMVTQAIYSNYNWFRDSVLVTATDTAVLPKPESGNYFVIAIDSNNCADTSQIFEVVNVVEGISNMGHTVNLKLYPNPNSGSFVLETSNSIGSEFIIYDYTGRVIIDDRIKNDKQPVVLNGVSAGAYMLQVKGSPGGDIRFTVNK